MSRRYITSTLDCISMLIAAGTIFPSFHRAYWRTSSQPFKHCSDARILGATLLTQGIDVQAALGGRHRKASASVPYDSFPFSFRSSIATTTKALPSVEPLEAFPERSRVYVRGGRFLLYNHYVLLQTQQIIRRSWSIGGSPSSQFCS